MNPVHPNRMNHRKSIVVGAAGGGLLCAAFLQVAVAVAETGSAADISDNAFTVDGFTLDPGADGYNPVSPLFGNAPLLEIGGGHLHIAGSDVDTAEQGFTVYNDSGAELGTVDTGVNAANVLGIDSAQFTVTSATSVDVDTDASAADIEAALNASGIDFSGAVDPDGDPVSLSDIATALAGKSDTSILGGDVSVSSVNNVFDPAPGYIPATLDFADSGFSAQDVVNALDDANGGDLLPDDGTVYSITNIGGGFYNVYEAVPGSGDESTQITDTLVTPWGNLDVPTDYDATDPFHPTDSFAGLNVGSEGDSGGGDLPGSDNAFAIGGDTFDPGSDGWNDITVTSGNAPLLTIALGDLTVDLGGGSHQHLGLNSQSFEVYDGTGADADQIGTVDSYVNAANLLGIGSTQLTVSGGDGFVPADDIQSAIGDSVAFGDDAPISESDFFTALAHSDIDFTGDVSSFNVTQALGLTDIADDLGISESFGQYTFNPADVAPGITFDPSEVADAANASDLGDLEAANAAELPDDGTVYSVTDFGGGFENVYEATPSADGTAAASITDTLVTPFGNFDLDTAFDAIAALNPGSATDGLGNVDGLDAHAFTIGDSTFDPGSDGWDPVSALFGVAPLMEIGGAHLPAISFVPAQDLATQNLDVYNGDGDQVGSIDTAVNTSNILGIDTTQFTVTDVDAADGFADSGALPTDGTVYSVTDLGLGIYNVYEAIPNDDGDAAASIQDTLVTPWGNLDLSTMFDAVADLMPGDAAAGVDAVSGGDLFGDLGGIFG